MYAALITGTGSVEIREFAEPTPTDAGVVVDITFCGVCGTDVHAYTSGRTYTPAICGHEWTGTVSAVGRWVSRVAEGDRVVVGVPGPCGTCESCRAGHPRQCVTAAGFARGRDVQAPPHGGFAPRIAVHADRVIAAHPDLDDETLAQVEPVTVSLHAVRQSGLREGETAVILGVGPVGLTTMQCARAVGAGQVIVVEPSAARRAMAESLGATVVASPGSAGEMVAQLTAGHGADVVFECVGGQDTLQAAVELTRRGGSVCLVGLADGPSTVDTGSWMRKEISITTALAYVHDEFVESMDLLADGRVRVDGMHTVTTRLEGLGPMLDDLASGHSAQTKVLVNPNW